MSFNLRKAVLKDQAEIEQLISQSVKGLSRDDYSEQQIELSIQSVFGVDTDLIVDETYFVAESNDKKIVGCGGWSKRRTLYGASRYEQSRNAEELDPKFDAAKIRAFFIHPECARQGVGTAILQACENEAKQYGFQRAEMMSTLPGAKLYRVRGYEGNERVGIPVGDGVEIECIVMNKKLV